MDAARQIIKQLLELQVELARLGLAHRDIKAENLVVTEDYVVKLIDFGFAYNLAEGPATDTKGSGCYTAPEILQSLPHCPSKADIFATGVVLYLLLTGDYPWVKADGKEAALYSYSTFYNGRKTNLFWRNVANTYSPGKQPYDAALTSLLDGMFHRDPEQRLTA